VYEGWRGRKDVRERLRDGAERSLVVVGHKRFQVQSRE
jgi:hypothetical protein